MRLLRLNAEEHNQSLIDDVMGVVYLFAYAQMELGKKDLEGTQYISGGVVENMKMLVFNPIQMTMCYV